MAFINIMASLTFSCYLICALDTDAEFRSWAVLLPVQPARHGGKIANGAVSIFSLDHSIQYECRKTLKPRLMVN